MPKRKPKQRLTALKIDRVAFVDRGDNPEADIVLMKRRDPVEKQEEESAPRLFDDVAEDRRASEVGWAIDERIDALSQSIFEILFHPDVEDREALILQSVDQFSETMSEDVGPLLSGELAKQWQAPEALPTVAEIAKGITETLSGIEGTEEDMSAFDISKLDENARGYIWEQAEKVNALSEKVEALEKSLSEKDAELAKAREDDDKAVDITKGMTKAQKAEWAEMQKRDEERGKQVAELVRKDRRKDFVLITKGLRNIPKPAEEVADLLMKAEDNGMLEEVAELVRTTDDALKNARTLDQIGSGSAGTLGSAYQKARGKAEELRQKDPSLSVQQAMAKVYDADPALLTQALKDGSAPN